MLKKLLQLLYFIICLFSCINTFATEKTNDELKDRYPYISELSVTDGLFLQYNEDVQQSYRDIAAKKEVILQIFTYKAKETDDLLSISSRCNIPYETIATLNHIAFVDENINKRLLFLPTCPGIFVSNTEKTQLDAILLASHFENYSESCYTINNEEFSFYPNLRLNATQRAFFTDSEIFQPINNGILSSPYGYRISPITGIKQFHQGIDIAAPIGTQVFACKSGIVRETGSSFKYGNYIMIKHDEKTISLYAHLSRILVKNEELVTGGECIGNVGSTGLSTGAHLHFEIRIDGNAENPEDVSSQFIY